MPRFKVKRNKQGNSRNKNKKRLKESPKELHEDPKIVPKYKNCLNFLNSRELGVTACLQAKQEFYRMKTPYKEKSAYSNLRIPSGYDSCEVNFIRGDDTQICGMWCMSNGQEINYVIGDITINEDIDNPRQCYTFSEKIVDICPGIGSSIKVPDCSSERPPPILEIYNATVSKRDYNKVCPPPWYCCCLADLCDYAILGGDGYIAYCGFGPPVRDNVPGKVCTVSHLMLSKVELCGLHTGELWIIDYRTQDRCSIKISDEAINDSLFLNDQEVIVGDVNGKLVKVDLRARKTSAEFFGHKHSVTKRPFSIANDMLCATGVDNVVRIWEISGGFPIHEMNSTSRHEVRGWLSIYGSKTHLNYFERDTRTVFTL